MFFFHSQIYVLLQVIKQCPNKSYIKQSGLQYACASFGFVYLFALAFLFVIVVFIRLAKSLLCAVPCRECEGGLGYRWLLSSRCIHCMQHATSREGAVDLILLPGFRNEFIMHLQLSQGNFDIRQDRHKSRPKYLVSRSSSFVQLHVLIKSLL